MELRVEKALTSYVDAYQKLYKRTPKDIQALDHEWVIVNGARIRIDDLNFMTRQLTEEYEKGLAQRRGMVNRLIHWLRGQ